ncbi:ABC transporter permease [Devosia ginsengisoli]|uniref:ABC transporter permease n=1 Tax=Devosia ginsengisoli TaxID=400770 RepID=A0A5B8LWB3_9HYPH|nr:ABC transporter permease [Devosia ginsengisoli]QDZ11924.1 ABC transporter permease [Devosia ginsengisoli]
MSPHHFRLAANIGLDLLRALGVAVGIVVFTFFVIRMIPGDVVDVRGIEGSLTYSQQSVMREELGLNKPWLTQFIDWSGMILSGDLGQSARFARPIADLLGAVLPSTLLLGATALAIGIVVGVTVSVLAVLFPRSIFAPVVDFITIWSITVPTFSIGIMSLIVFAVWLGWIPAIGNFLVPALILGLDTAGSIAKALHEDMREVQASEFVRAARARGVSHARIVLRHILPNALTVTIAIIGLMLAGVFTGAITMEVVFGLPGLGTLTLQAIKGRDYAVVQAIIIWLGVTVIFANFVADTIRKLINPRLRTI